MKKVKLIINGFVTWACILFDLICEIFLFIIKLPYYLYLFFYGLRITTKSYSDLLSGLEDIKKSKKELFESRVSEQTLTGYYTHLLKEIKRLQEEQEKSFATLFGIFIAVLALFISIIALLIKR